MVVVVRLYLRQYSCVCDEGEGHACHQWMLLLLLVLALLLLQVPPLSAASLLGVPACE